eukprot:g4448.t1
MLKTIVSHVKYKQRLVNSNIKVVMKNSMYAVEQIVNNILINPLLPASCKCGLQLAGFDNYDLHYPNDRKLQNGNNNSDDLFSNFGPTLLAASNNNNRYFFKNNYTKSSINRIFGKRFIHIENANTRKLDCIKFDKNGEYTRKDIKVIDLLRLTNLHARDLIPLEKVSSLGRTASIQPRTGSIVVSISHLRSIITHDSLYVLDPESFAVQQFVDEFSSTLKSSEQNDEGFELLALEGILSNVATKYSRRVACFGPMISSLLDELRNTETPLNNTNAGASILTRILPIRNTLSHYERSSE